MKPNCTTVSGLAVELGISTAAVRKAVSDGTLTATKDGSVWLIHKDEKHKRYAESQAHQRRKPRSAGPQDD